MAGFFRNLFGNNQDSTSTRTLTHPRELQAGDIIKFKFTAQPLLSNQQFEIGAIGTYDFEDRQLTEFKLTGQTDTSIYLIVDESDDETTLSLSLKITHETVESLFDLDQFAEIFDGDGHTTLHRKTEPSDYEGWTSSIYRQEIMAEGGYYYQQDYRGKALPEHEDAGDDFQYCRLVSNNRQHLIETEVYEEGETDVLLTLHLPITDIEEMWPKSKA